MCPFLNQSMTRKMGLWLGQSGIFLKLMVGFTSPENSGLRVCMRVCVCVCVCVCVFVGGKVVVRNLNKIRVSRNEGGEYICVETVNIIQYDW